MTPRRDLIAQLSCYAVLALMLAIVWWAPEIVEVTSWIRD